MVCALAAHGHEGDFLRLVVQVPCLNEEETLPLVLRSLPTEIPGIDEIIILIIDDGSSDRTVEVAEAHGVTHFVRHARNQGLGRSFHDGVQRALELGADIVVNTDGDNQYPQDRIADLVQPIIAGKADIVIADRQVHLVEHFSRAKVALQKLGSRIVNVAAGTDLPDAASGFRAYSRDSLMVLNTITRFSYCMETIIQAGNKKLKIVSIPVLTNDKTRESRLFKSTAQHVRMSAGAIIRAYIMYKPYVIFTFVAAVFGALGLVRSCGSPSCRSCPTRRARTCSRCSRRDPADHGIPQCDHRDHLRPDPHQAHPDRRHSGTYEEDALRLVAALNTLAQGYTAIAPASLPK
jgi:glycosyltransferase involved in cell wall biosynthesis